MKSFLLASFLSLSVTALIGQTPCEGGFAGTYPCRNMDLLAFMTLSDVGSTGNGTNTNDVWGWVSPVTGKEYALLGCSWGTSFIDVSNPSDPLYLGYLPTHTVPSLWRDLEAYNNYCYIVSEAEGHGLQIFDLLQLDEVSNAPVIFDESAYYDGFGHCHTLNIDPVSGYCYCNGTGTFSGGLHIVNINDPLNPTLAGGFAGGGYTHDCYAWTYDGPDPDWQGKEIIFACNDNYVYLVDVTDKTDCQEITHVDYNGEALVGYIHQGWITKDKSHFLVDDETDEIGLDNDNMPYGTRTHMFDIEDIDAVSYQGFYEANSTSIDHNLYVLDQFVYESNYRSGVRVLDAALIDNAVMNEVAYFDLYPLNDFAQFSGTWSNYPYLPSGIVLATSMYDGMFILEPKILVLAQEDWELCGSDEIVLDLQVNADLHFPLTFGLEGLGSATASGNTVEVQGGYAVTISGLSGVTPGNYSPKLLLQTNFGEEYEIPFSVNISDGLANAPVLTNLPDDALVNNSDPSILFNWESTANADTYIFELSADAGFSSTIEVESSSLNSFLLNYDLPDGEYFWRVRASNACGDGPWSEVFSFQIIPVGIDETESADLSIAPNPAADVLMIRGAGNAQEIRVMDAAGRTVISISENQTSFMRLPVSELPSGVYTISIDGKSRRFIRE